VVERGRAASLGAQVAGAAAPLAGTMASNDRKSLQTAVDGAIKLDATLTAYLKARFSLSKGQKPHEMKF
jgi:hypothetical protein